MNIHLWFPNIFEFKGGIQTYLLDFLNALPKNKSGISFSVYDKLDEFGSNQNFYKDIDFYFSGNIPKPLQTFHFSIQLIQSALFRNPDLIICGHVNFAPVAYLISYLRNIPYWILVYGVDAWDVQQPLKRRALRSASCVVSIGDYTRDRLILEQNLSKSKIPLLPVTFDSSHFRVDVKPNYLLARYGLKPNQPTILTVARLSEEDQYKGYDQILKSLATIRQAIPDVHYVLVGKGGDRPRIEALIQSLNLQDYVTLAGFVPDEELCDHYNLCDVFAMPSKGEGFGIVYLEALACGKPTLGGNQDGAIDALVNGELGVLVDPDDVDEIAQSLTLMLQRKHPHPLLYKPKVLRERTIKYFGFEKFQQTLETLLEEHFRSRNVN